MPIEGSVASNSTAILKYTMYSFQKGKGSLLVPPILYHKIGYFSCVKKNTPAQYIERGYLLGELKDKIIHLAREVDGAARAHNRLRRADA